MHLKFISGFFLLCILACFSSEAQILWQVTDGKVTQWNYLDGDEFNGSKLDTSKWRNDYPWARHLFCSPDKHYYTDFNNIKVEDGILSLIAKKEKIKAKSVPYESDTARLFCDGKDAGINFREFDYTSGMIFSKQKYHYGFYEMKFKSDEGNGLWPAFWLYAGHESDEIDIFEMNGSRNTEMHVDVHCKSGCKNYKTTLGLIRKNWGDYLTTSGNWKNGYNVIAIEWQPGFIKWFLNGEAVAYWKGKFDYPMWVIANFSIALDGGPFGPGPDANTKFPASFDIDYIRMWSTVTPSAKRTLSVTLDVMADSNSGAKSKLLKGKKPESKKKIIKAQSTFILFTATGNNNYKVEFTGSRPKDFTIEVLDPSGNSEYKSSDTSKSIHEFKIAGNGKLRIKTGVTVLEQSF